MEAGSLLYSTLLYMGWGGDSSDMYEVAIDASLAEGFCYAKGHVQRMPTSGITRKSSQYRPAS